MYKTMQIVCLTSMFSHLVGVVIRGVIMHRNSSAVDVDAFIAKQNISRPLRWSDELLIVSIVSL